MNCWFCHPMMNKEIPMSTPPPNIDPDEIARFGALADMWWQRRGVFKALHDINPVRLDYVDQHAGLSAKTVLDVGCGGGLLSEAMARRGARVTGIDMSAQALAVARRHAGSSGLHHIDYRHATAEAWALEHPAAYDIVTCMELVEHVPDPAALVGACARLVRPGGDLFFATVNRTLPALLLVILMAEHVLGIVRKGTHRYDRLVRPDEMKAWGRKAGLALADVSGLRYIPFGGRARLCKSVQMNYLMHFKTKPRTDDHGVKEKSAVV